MATLDDRTLAERFAAKVDKDLSKDPASYEAKKEAVVTDLLRGDVSAVDNFSMQQLCTGEFDCLCVGDWRRVSTMIVGILAPERLPKSKFRRIVDSVFRAFGKAT